LCRVPQLPTGVARVANAASQSPDPVGRDRSEKLSCCRIRTEPQPVSNRRGPKGDPPNRFDNERRRNRPAVLPVPIRSEYMPPPQGTEEFPAQKLSSPNCKK